MKTIVFTLFVVFVLLNGTVLFADSTWVSGTIVGETWTIGNSPYCVNGDINVATLEIEPGVSVIFFGNYKFEVAGTLKAIGTEQDSIIFTKVHPDTVGWRAILFNHIYPGSELAYCRIEGASNHGIFIDSCDVTIRNCTITSNSSGSSTIGGGIYINSNVPLTLTDCIISKNSVSASNAGWGGGIFCTHAPLTLTNCIISNNSITTYGYTPDSYGGGIYCDTTLILYKCVVLNNSVYSEGSGIYSKGVSRGGGIYISRELSLTNCLIDSNIVNATASGLGNYGGWTKGGGIYVIGTLPSTARNCIVSHNTSSGSYERLGGGIYNETGALDLINSTIAYNTHEGLRNEGGTVTAMNSILYFNTDAQISGNATVTYSNVLDGWGEPADSNINYNPVFFSPESLIILPGSPCIDKGNPDPIYNDVCFPPSLGTVRNDMGAHGGPFGCDWIDISYVEEIPSSTLPNEFYLEQNYPNPFNPETKLEFTLSKGCHVRLDIYNILGKRIRTLINEHQTAGYKRVSWDGKDDNGYEVPTGVYFYRIKAGEFTQAKKMVLLK